MKFVIHNREIEEWLAQEDSSGSFPKVSSRSKAIMIQAPNQEPIQENQPPESDRDDEPLSRAFMCFYGKNSYKSAKDPPNRAVRTGQHNIIARMRESRLNERDEKDPVSLWKKLTTPDDIEVILQWTNVKIRELKLKYKTFYQKIEPMNNRN